MSKKMIKVTLPERFCPSNPNAIEDIMFQSARGLYKMVLSQPHEFYRLCADDFKLLLEPDEETITSFVDYEHADRLENLKKKYSVFSYQQLMKILILKKFKNKA